MRTSGRALRRLGWLAPLVLVTVLAAASWPVGGAQARGLQPSHTVRPLHALPVRYDPAQNAVLQAPPARVRITFNEHVNPDISKIVVVDPSNRQVDSGDSAVSDDGLTMTVSLPLLPAGTYVVFWRTHSADDGHVAGGSYLFHIARADGTVPPLSGPLPRGTIIGGGGVASTNALDGPNLLGALARWVALLALTLLLGMIFWATFVQPRQRTVSAGFAGEIGRLMGVAASRALAVLLVASVVEAAAQLILLEGSPAGLVSPPLLRSVLLQSRFGGFLLLRAALGLIGLGALLRPRLGERLVPDRRVRDAALALFGLGLALAFEYSGHGGSAPAWWGPIVDYLHLLANGIWLGGLLTLAVVIVPALARRGDADRAAYLASSIPAFSVPALAAVAFVTVTGPLNGAVRMTALQQIWTTPYGIVLIVKSVLFLLMVAISYHHAFRLRPRLGASAGVGSADGAGLGVDGGSRGLGAPFPRFLAFARVSAPGPEAALAVSPSGAAARRGGAVASAAPLDRAIMRWMRVEAAVGVGVLLCAALLGPLAGTLTPNVATAASFGAQGGVQTQSQQVDGLGVTMGVDPGRFGTNTFTVVVKNPDGTPASDGTVFLVSSMVEMDMGSNTIDLAPSGRPGTYTGQGELPMAGHWKLQTVIRTKQDPNNLHRAMFTVSVSY